MEIPHRTLRTYAMDADPLLRDMTTREIERQERILTVATALFARFGRTGITFRGMAVAMKMATATLRKRFTCLDSLLGHILLKHLQEIATALGRVPPDAPNRQQAMRAAYLEHTRSFNAFTQPHLLWVHLRNCLPADERDPLEQIYLDLGHALAGPLAAQALSLLDNPVLDGPRIERFLQTYAEPEAHQAEHHPPPPQPPPEPRIAVSMVLPKRLSLGQEQHPDDVMIIRGFPPEPPTHAPPCQADPPRLRNSAHHAQHAA